MSGRPSVRAVRGHTPFGACNLWITMLIGFMGSPDRAANWVIEHEPSNGLGECGLSNVCY